MGGQPAQSSTAPGAGSRKACTGARRYAPLAVAGCASIVSGACWAAALQVPGFYLKLTQVLQLAELHDSGVLQLEVAQREALFAGLAAQLKLSSAQSMASELAAIAVMLQVRRARPGCGSPRGMRPHIRPRDTLQLLHFLPHGQSRPSCCVGGARIAGVQLRPAAPHCSPPCPAGPQPAGVGQQRDAAYSDCAQPPAGAWPGSTTAPPCSSSSGCSSACARARTRSHTSAVRLAEHQGGRPPGRHGPAGRLARLLHPGAGALHQGGQRGARRPDQQGTDCAGASAGGGGARGPRRGPQAHGAAGRHQLPHERLPHRPHH